MLHTKFHENQPAGSGEDQVVCNHIWAWQPFWSCDLDFTIKLDSPHKISLIGPAVSEKKIFEKCVWTTDWPRSRDDLDLH